MLDRRSLNLLIVSIWITNHFIYLNTAIGLAGPLRLPLRVKWYDIVRTAHEPAFPSGMESDRSLSLDLFQSPCTRQSQQGAGLGGPKFEPKASNTQNMRFHPNRRYDNQGLKAPFSVLDRRSLNLLIVSIWITNHFIYLNTAIGLAGPLRLPLRVKWYDIVRTAHEPAFPSGMESDRSLFLDLFQSPCTRQSQQGAGLYHDPKESWPKGRYRGLTRPCTDHPLLTRRAS